MATQILADVGHGALVADVQFGVVVSVEIQRRDKTGVLSARVHDLLGNVVASPVVRAVDPLPSVIAMPVGTTVLAEVSIAWGRS